MKLYCSSNHCTSNMKCLKLGVESGYTAHFIVTDSKQKQYHIKQLGKPRYLKESSLNEYFVRKILENLNYGPLIIGFASCYIDSRLNSYPMVITYDLNNDDNEDSTMKNTKNQFFTLRDLQIANMDVKFK